MKALSRVVWSEGMHLAQHHFQAQSQYIESLTHFVLQNLAFRAHGLISCSLDHEALLNGTVTVIHARGLMPDGLPFHFPEDTPPAPLNVRDRFSPTQDRHVVMLAIPPFRPERANSALQPGEVTSSTRFLREVEPLLDETTGQDAKPVAFARKNFRLVLDTEDTQELVTLPLARVRRDGAGNFVYDPEYVPPCIQIGASERLLTMLAGLVDLLDGKADAARANRGSIDQRTGDSSRELLSFWLSHTIHASLPTLRHLAVTRSHHPERLYLEMARLAGALCTFSMESHPRDLPLYDHDDLEVSFSGLERLIRQNLELVAPTSSVTIPLTRTGEYLFTGEVKDPRFFQRSHWYLGVRSGIGAGELISRVPKLVKVCADKFVLRLVQEAVDGLMLEHAPSPPSAISPRLGMEYFRVHRSPVRNAAGAMDDHPCWKALVGLGGIGVYVPEAIPNAEIDLAIVLER